MTTPEARFENVPLAQLHESALNPRKHFDEKKLAELTASVRTKGVQTPLIVRPNKDGYEIAAGHRRYRAAKGAKLAVVPAFIREMTDEEFLELLNFENLLREDVHPLEEADGYRTLMEKSGYDVPAIAAKIGKSVAYVYARLKLADLIEPARRAFLDEELTAGHAILLARLQPKDQDEALGYTLQTREVDIRLDDERRGAVIVKAACSVRELSAWIGSNVHLDLAAAPWKKDDAELLPRVGACTTCPKRTGNAPELFPDVKKGDTCTDRACFGAKLAAFVNCKVAELKADGAKEVLRLSVEYGYGRNRKADVVYETDWRPMQLGKAKGCAKTIPGVFVDGGRAGQVLMLCPDAKCETHHNIRRGGAYLGERRDVAKERASQAALNLKVRRDTESRRRIFTALLERTKAPLSVAALREVSRRLIRELWSDTTGPLVRALGLESEARREHTATLRKHIDGLDEAGCHRFLVALSIARDIPRSSYAGDKDELIAAARDVKVDVGKIQRAVANEIQPKKKPAAKPTKPAQTSAPKKKGKKS